MAAFSERPVRLLSLDGGGVRGLSSLYILQFLMKRVNPNNPPKPCNYFDLIGGTSTGGLIAIMLGRFGMSVDECINKYIDLSPKAFEWKRPRANLLGKSKDWWKIRGAFKEENLAEEFKIMAKEYAGNDPEAPLYYPEGRCKVFVCVTAKESTTTELFRSYDNDMRPETENCAIWQAARATTAAPTFFDPIKIGLREFVDGGLGNNNPVELVYSEAKDLWPPGTGIQCLVSIGTGSSDLRKLGDNVPEIVESLKKIAAETKKTESRFYQYSSSHGLHSKYFRFDVPSGLQSVKLHEHEENGRIKSFTMNYLNDPRNLDSVNEFVKAQALQKGR